MLKKISIFLLIITISQLFSYEEICRGANEGEIFLSSYLSQVLLADGTISPSAGILYSPDHGETLEIKYLQTNANSGLNSFSAFECALFLDGGGEVLYGITNFGNYSFYRSYDYGETWEVDEDHYNDVFSFFVGFSEGETYKIDCVDSAYDLYRSTDFGYEYELVTETIPKELIRGSSVNEIYGFEFTEEFPHSNPIIVRSIDGGETFNQLSQILTDSDGNNINFFALWDRMLPGHSPGELYLVKKSSDDCDKIYYSSDFGETFHYKNDVYTNISYQCVGSEPGEIYITANFPYTNDNGEYETRIEICYSSDYGESFTKYTHRYKHFSIVDIDNTETIVSYKLSNYPNPFKYSEARRNSSTTISFESKQDLENPNLEIYNVKGQLVKTISKIRHQSGNFTVKWNGINNNQNQVSSGVYLYRVTSDGFESKFNKMIILK